MKKFALLGLLALSACANPKEALNENNFDSRDPIKPFNQAVFSFNLAADQYFIGPVAHGYHQVPDLGRRSVSNFVTNLSEPSNVLNGILQGDATVAFTSLWRFILNTTLGLGGLNDVAVESGLKYQDQNFGKTLASYGVSDGAYVVLPIVGPSSVRGTTGLVVDWVTDPVGWYLTTPESIAQTATDGIVTRDEEDSVIDQLYYRSLDPYVATRAAYLQHQDFKNKE